MQSIPSAVSPALLASASDIGFNLSHQAALIAWRQHARAMFPNEAVAFFMKDGGFLPVENTHANPRDFFAFDAALFIAHEDQIAGIVHSHTPGMGDDPKAKPQEGPSAADMQSQIDTDVPWGLSIVTTAADGGCSNPVWWGDALPIRPLIGRVFLHGIADCFATVRDWHRLQGITFADVPRDDNWWKSDKDLYMDLFEKRGFKRVQRVAKDGGLNVKVGDCFICSLHSDKRNHAGVFVSSDTFLHHPGGSLSLRSQAIRWKSKLDFLVRHKDLPEEA